MKRGEARQQPVAHGLHRGEVHHRGEAVVGRLAAIDVVVRMHRLACAQRLAQQFIGAVRDDLIGVHVGLGTGTGLPDRQREVGVASAGLDLGGGGLDGLGNRLGQFTESAIGLGRRPFLQAGGADHAGVESRIADAEQGAGAFGLRAPIALGRDLDGAEGVGFGASGGHSVLQPAIWGLSRPSRRSRSRSDSRQGRGNRPR